MIYYHIRYFEFEYDESDGDPAQRYIHDPLQAIREAIRCTHPVIDILTRFNIPHHYAYSADSALESQLRYHNGDPSSLISVWRLTETVQAVVYDHDVAVQIRLACGIKPNRID